MASTSSFERATWGIAFQVEPSPSRPETKAASITSCSKAQMRRADTSPPSCPVPCTAGSVARARTVRLEMPATSSSVRGRPNRWFSISGSQVRKRGQARVHRVQPLRPWVQLSGPPSAATWNGL